MNLSELHESIVAAGVPLVTLRSSGGTITAVYDDGATAQQRATGDALVAAWVAPTALQEARDLAKRLLQNDGSGPSKLDRAIALITLDEVNVLRQWITDFKSAVAAATNFADLKVRIAALGNTPQRTKAQLLNAIAARIDGGEAD